mmetsp:Transcript_36708/g.77027  ORF Transcript_36708/g.77027 Transcript_36708/m.77027 type:complete len:480 (+) Transcript_36708:65-1504(+)
MQHPTLAHALRPPRLAVLAPDATPQHAYRSPQMSPHSCATARTARSAAASPSNSVAGAWGMMSLPQTPSASPSSRSTPHLMHMGSCLPPPASVAVISPGAGTGINGAVYADLCRDPRFRVEMVGQSRAPYDRYPESWENGGPPPNLASFADEVLHQGVVDHSDCLVLGSRGGQVVLPILWQARGNAVPPSIVINGGCAMGLPGGKVYWPDSAVTFLLLGGQDFFMGDLSPEKYVADTQSRVPAGNTTTAILYVQEMQHMPQGALLGSILHHMLRAILLWRGPGGAASPPPLEEFRQILGALNRDGWSGRLLFTAGAAGAGLWEDIAFSPFQVSKRPGCHTPAEPLAPVPIELSRHDELKELWKAAACAATTGGGVPLADGGARFAAAAQAALAQVAQAAQIGGTATCEGTPRPRHRPMLPIPAAGSGKARMHPSPHLRSCAADPTPISKALGITTTYISPASSCGHSPCRFSPTAAMVR